MELRDSLDEGSWRSNTLPSAVFDAHWTRCRLNHTYSCLPSTIIALCTFPSSSLYNRDARQSLTPGRKDSRRRLDPHVHLRAQPPGLSGRSASPPSKAKLKLILTDPTRSTCSWPGVICFSEIYQVTGPVERVSSLIIADFGPQTEVYLDSLSTPPRVSRFSTRPISSPLSLASHAVSVAVASQGYIVVCPSSFHEFEGPEAIPVRRDLHLRDHERRPAPDRRP